MITAWISLPVALIAFMLPGVQVARRLGGNAPVLIGFFISCALWLNLILILNAFGVPLDRTHLVATWAGLSVGACGWAWRKPLASTANEPWIPEGLNWLWVLPPLFALISIGIRGVVDPINGWDNSFRWDGLAQKILLYQNLDFYPPVTAAHFEIYAWCDGIPPLVPLLNFWIYLVTGSSDPALIVGRILGEAALIGAAVFMLARALWGREAGWPALAIAATSSLLLWGVSTSQETGLTALSLPALVYFCIKHREQPSWKMAVAAGLAAGIGALSREYGLAFVLLGGAIFMLSPAGRRTLLAYSAAAALMAGPWYVRNWILTGNPLYSNNLGGLFPTNAIYTETMKVIASYWKLGTGLHNERLFAWNILIIVGLSLPGALAGLIMLKSRRWLPCAAIVLICGLWLWSLPLTGGGWNYSVRVLTPMTAVCAALCGWLGTFPRLRRAGLALALVFSVDAARRSWFLPMAPNPAPLPYTFTPWREWREFTDMITQHPVWAFLAVRTRDCIVIVDSPTAHTLIKKLGGRASMIFSPAVDPCFDDTLSFEQCREALRHNNVRWIALTIDDPVAQVTIKRHPFLRTLVEKTAPYARANSVAIYDLNAKAQPLPATP